MSNKISDEMGCGRIGGMSVSRRHRDLMHRHHRTRLLKWGEGFMYTSEKGDGWMNELIDWSSSVDPSTHPRDRIG